MLKKRKQGSGPGADALPGYRALKEIGGGASATVYRAVEEDTGRAVALKILKVDTIHARLLETFHHEIQALATVSDHPNIVTLYRPLTTPDGRPVLVLELCKESLAQQVRTSGPLDARVVVKVGIKVAGALETAHRHGFLHRDMKPQNILTTNFGEPALADFGVAALQASAQATAGVFGFTTLHAAPEMLEGHVLSPATDIYGLASTMYQLLTGLAPFATFDNEAPASVILRIIRDPVRPLRSEGVPFELSDLLEASLAKEPMGRPATALDFAARLQRIEDAQGWPLTDYVAWGTVGASSQGDPSVAPPRRGPSGEVAPHRTDAVGSSEPSTRPPVTFPDRDPAPLPVSVPAPPEPTPDPPSPTTVAPSHAARRTDAAASPEPGLASVGPSVATPEIVARSVAPPADVVRGPPERPLEASRVPLQPLPDRDVPLPPSSRPVFVDPGEEHHPVGPSGQTVYEETMQVAELFAASRSRQQTDNQGCGPRPVPMWRRLPAYAVIGVVAAVVVVIVAVLLIVGAL